MASVTLIDVGKIVSSRWITVVVATACTTSLLLLSTFWITPEYRAQVTLLAARDATPSWAGTLNRINTVSTVLSGGAQFKPTSPKAVAVGTLLSQALTEDYIRDRHLLPVLFAERWDVAAGAWHLRYGQAAPTPGDGVNLFERRIRTVSEDRRTGLITLQIDWSDPELAAQWANDLATLTNSRLRERAIDGADSNIAYLEQRLRSTDVTGLSDAISRSLGAQLGMRMVLGGTGEYAFRIVDPAVVPDERFFPRRWEFAALGFLSGLLGCAYCVLIGHERRLAALP